MRATRLLEAQHAQVAALIDQLVRRTTGRNRRVRELADALAAHMLVEEEILYPVARTIQKKVIDHAVEEHDIIAIAMQRLLATHRNDPRFEVRAELLRTLLQHHVAIEENAVFPTLEQLLLQPQMEALGRQVEERFNQVIVAGSQQILSLRATRITCPPPGTLVTAGEMAGRGRRRGRRVR